MNQQVPSVGRIVHFVYGGQHVPAIITDPAFQDYGTDGQSEPRIMQALTVFLPNAAPFTTVAERADEVAPGTWTNATWHWPERIQSAAEQVVSSDNCDIWIDLDPSQIVQLQEGQFVIAPLKVNERAFRLFIINRSMIS